MLSSPTYELMLIWISGEWPADLVNDNRGHIERTNERKGEKERGSERERDIYMLLGNTSRE